MTTDIRALIDEIQALDGKPSRELEDRVLLACTEWHYDADDAPWSNDPGRGLSYCWFDPDDNYTGTIRPSPLSNLQDATLAAPEGMFWHLGNAVDGKFFAVVETTFALANRMVWDAVAQPDPARALVLAGLKAREQEAEG